MAHAIPTIVRDVVARVLDVAPDRLTPETYFTYDLGADSLDMVEIVMALEATLKIDVPNADVEAIKTFGDAVAVAERLTAAAAPVEA